MDWFRVYTEITRDNKLRRLPPAQRWLWIAVLSLARRSPIPGYLLLSPNVPVTFEDLADEAKIDIEEVEEAFAYYQDKEMIHVEDGVFVVTHWDERQFTSDDTTTRVKRWRVQRRNVSDINECNGDVTLQQRFSNVTETFSDTDTESDIYINSSSNDDELIASDDAPESASLKEPDTEEEKISGLTEYINSPEKSVKSGATATLTAGQKLFLVKFGRKRFATADQAKAIAQIEADVGFEVLEKALTWAAENNIRAVSSIRTAARKMARDSPLGVPKRISVYDDPMFQRLQAEGKL